MQASLTTHWPRSRRRSSSCRNGRFPWYDAAATFVPARALMPRPRPAATLEEAREHADGFLRTKIDYALGNTALFLGDVPAAIACYDDCLESTASGKGLDAVRRDAMANRQFALEQPQPPALSQGESSGDQPKSERPDRRRNSNRRNDGGDSPDDQPETGQGGGGANPESEPNAEGENNRPPTRRRRIGGAGGGRSTAPGAQGDSPDDRLDAALEHIHAAQSRRLPDDPPAATANDDRRDW